jgi:F-box-like
MDTVLPVEILQIIFQQFKRQAEFSVLSRVCRQWHVVATCLLYRCPKLESETQIKLFCQSSEAARAYIQQVDFSTVSSWLTDEILSSLIPEDKNSRAHKSIRSLGLANCNRLSCQTIFAFLKSCSLDHVLQEAVFANCLLSDQIISLLSQSRSVRKLNICNTMIQPCVDMETSHCLGPFAKACENLEELDMSFCAWVDQHTMDTICRLRHLRKLSIRWCHRVPIQSIFHIVQHLSSLQSLDVRHVNGANHPDIIRFVLYLRPSLGEVYFTQEQKIMTCARRLAGGDVEMAVSG